jgi:nitrite reductase/ring-hydroxylating ferredoxin subunit
MVDDRLCGRDDVRLGEMKVFRYRGRELAVARTGEDEFRAVRNVCPHQGAPLGRGFLTGTFLASDYGEYNYGRDGEIIRCPWHRWEFDSATGSSLHDPKGCRVASYTLRVDGDDVLVVGG